MPMWRPPHTIRSPVCGGCVPAGIALPARCAQSQTCSTEPKPWPCSPSGAPTLRAAQETKYAHQGPTPEPAVACRYCAIRGASLEPGGCSATPTSWRARLTIACPAGVPPVAGSAVAPAVPDVVWPIRLANVALAGAAVCAVVVATGAATGLGANTELSSAMRAATASTDIADLQQPRESPSGRLLA